MIREFIFSDPPFASCHASTLVELVDGRFMVAWFGGTHEKHDDVAIWGALRSEHGWSKPVCLAKVDQQPHWNPVLFSGGGDTLFLYFKVGPNCSHWYTMVMESVDNGATWSEPVELVPGDDGGRGPVKNKCITLADGSWLAPASTEIGRWEAFVDRSEDGGRTWQRSATVPMPDKVVGTDKQGNDVKLGVIQPTLWESTPGHVHMLLRSSAGAIYRSDSSDNGQTWCPVYATDLPNNNSGIDLAKLADDSLLLAYNPVGENWGARYPMTLAMSVDNGDSWQRVADIETEPREYSYPAIIPTTDGGAALTYTWGREHIVFAHFAPEEIAAFRI